MMSSVYFCKTTFINTTMRTSTELKSTEQLRGKRQAFMVSALKAEREVAEHGLVYDAEEVFRYIKAKIEGHPIQRPQAVTLK